MKTYTSFKKFDRKYLFLEYNLVPLILSSKNLTKKSFNSDSFKIQQPNETNFIYFNQSLQFKNIDSYLKLIESTIQKDFILLNNFWMFFKIYSTPKLFRFFPDRRSFFCYWLFPFVGFITISHFNTGLQKHVPLVDSCHLIDNSKVTKMNMSINWDRLEYLNYKKVFLNNYFEPFKTKLFNKNDRNQQLIDKNIKNSLQTSLIEKENSPKSFNNEQIQLYFQPQQHYESVKNKKVTNFEFVQTENLLTLCNFYLTQTEELIYKPDKLAHISKLGSYLSTMEGKKKNQMNLVKSNNIPTELIKSEFLSNGRNSILNSHQVTEFILRNNFQFRAFLKFSWYSINSKETNQYLKNKFFKNFPTLVNKYDPNGLNSQIILKGYSFFPKKLLPSLIVKYPIMIGKERSPKNVLSSYMGNKEVNSINLANIIDLELKDTDLLTRFLINSIKINNFDNEVDPISHYNKAQLILNSLLQNFEINFGLKLDVQKLNNLIIKELKINSKFLHSIKNLLTNSKFTSNKPLKLLSHTPELKSSLTDFLIQNVTQPEVFPFKVHQHGSHLDKNHFEGLNFQIIDSYFPRNEKFYHKLTKKYLNSVFLKKLIFNIISSNNLNSIPSSSNIETNLSKLIFRISKINKLQKNLVKFKINKVTNQFIRTIEMDNLNTLKNLTKISKSKLQRIVFLSNLKKKLNDQYLFILNRFIFFELLNTNSNNLFTDVLTKQSLDKNLSEQRSDLVNTSLNNLQELHIKHTLPVKFNKERNQQKKLNSEQLNSVFVPNSKKTKVINPNQAFLRNVVNFPNFQKYSLIKLFSPSSQHFSFYTNKLEKEKTIYVTALNLNSNNIFNLRNYNLLLNSSSDELFPFNKTVIKTALINEISLNENQSKLFTSVFQKQSLNIDSVHRQKSGHTYRQGKEDLKNSLKFVKTKIRLFSNNLHINQKLIKTQKFKEKFTNLNPFFSVKQNSNLLLSMNNKKNFTVWSDNKISNFNFKLSFNHYNKPKYILPLLGSMNQDCKIPSSSVTFNKNKLVKICKPTLNLSNGRFYSQFYSINKVNKQSFNILKYNISSNIIVKKSNKSTLINSVFNPSPKMVSTSRFKDVLTKQSLDKNLSEQRSNLVNTFLNNLYALDVKPRNLISKTVLRESDIWQNKFTKLKQIYLSEQLNHYIKNVKNRINVSLKNSKFSLLRIYNKKNLHLNKLFRKNFYLNINKNQHIILKINKINYHIKNNNQRHSQLAFLPLSESINRIAKSESIKENFENSFNIKTKKEIQFTKPIEKIFRSYLSSKYNKKMINESFSLNKRTNVSFLKSNSLFSHFKRQNRALGLKLSKKSKFNKNDLIISRQNTTDKSFFSLQSKIRPFLPLSGSMNRGKNAKALTFSRLGQNNLLYRGLQVKKPKKMSIKTPSHLIRKIGFIFFRNDSQFFTPIFKQSFQFDQFKLVNTNSNNLFTDVLTKQSLDKNLSEQRSDLVNTSLNNLQALDVSVHTSRQGKEEKYIETNLKKRKLVKKLEKAKNLQKKRRQKKQARLTGRRKKRKRFFPRPIWLRFLLYKKFLKSRHFQTLKSNNIRSNHNSLFDLVNTNSNNLFKDVLTKQSLDKNLSEQRSDLVNTSLNNLFELVNTNSNNLHALHVKHALDVKDSFCVKKADGTNPQFSNSLKQQNKHNLRSIKLSPHSINNKNIRQIIYRTNKQNWGNIFFEIPNLEKITIKKLFLIDSLPLFADVKFYDISTNLVNDFKKNIWKSYWLRTNFNNYINRITTYLNQIKLSIIESDVLQTLKKLLFEIVGLNIHENSLKLISLNLNLKNKDFSLLKQANHELLRIRRFSESPTSVDFGSKNIKLSSVLIDSYGPTKTGSISKEQVPYTLKEQTNIINLRTNDVFELTKFKKKSNSSLSLNKYGPLWYLNIRGNFLNFSNIASGYPYLFSTNLSQFNQSLYNRIQAIIKNIKLNLNVDGQNQLRAFNPGHSQLTNLTSDNFIINLIKDWWIRCENSLNFSFSVVNIPQEIYLNQTKFRILWALNKTNIWGFKKHSDNIVTWNKAKIREQNKSNKTNKILSNWFRTIKQFNQHNSSKREKLISQIFTDKFKTTNDKIKQLGLLLTDKNYLPIQNSKLQKIHELNKTNLNKNVSQLILRETLTSYFKTFPKNYLQFWWSENNVTSYNFFQTDLSFNSDVSFAGHLTPLLTFGKTNIENSIFKKMNFMMIWASLIVFHVSVLFSLLNISQIRSFLKFQLLFIYKLTNLYFTLIYSTFKNLKQVKTNLTLYSNVIASIGKNLPITKKSFLLRLYHSTNVSNRKIETNNTNKLIIYHHGKYIIFNNFKESILKSLNQYSNPRLQLAQPEVAFFSRSELENREPKFFEFDFLIQKFLTNQNNKANNKILSQLNIRKFTKYPTINLFILRNHFNNLSSFRSKEFKLFELVNTNSSSTIKQRQLIYLSKIEKTFSQNFTFLFSENENDRIIAIRNKSILKSTNLICYNILKLILGSIQTFSFKPTRLNILNNTMNSEFSANLNHFSTVQNLPNTYENIAFLVLNKYIKNSVYLSILVGFSLLLKLVNKSLIGVYTMLFKLIDLVEAIMLIIYKSLEKPAELMIDFISEFFLIEWSADILSFVPESLDIYTSRFFQKLTRNLRVLGFTSFLSQRRVLSFLDIFIERITKPDTDLIIRQKKGIIFWDVWAEILVQAAELYSINLSSLFNIKEEQDLFLEKLLNDKNWDWSSLILIKMSPLMQLINESKPNGFVNPSNLFLKSEQIWRRWSVNPYYTYQAKDTELFIESHPPKSFSHFKLMKYYSPIFEPVGNLICQIYSGTFVNTVSKNLLLIGSRGTNKTLLIQAIAGETELKLMIDNANRYSLTSRGVAIGMKLLKDVFDALALQAPCLFIIEDIHLIGERRPMLISDDENIKATENSFGVDQDEIHEKNQVIYQLSRHSIVHYKKPYKGDFSLLIPTNHFSLDFFLGFSPPKTRLISYVPQNPLPIKSIEQELSNQTDSTKKNIVAQKLKLLSQIQLPKQEVFSPPSTSPFTILLLKEQKKIKPKKIVSEMPWGGLSSDQLIQLPKASYSVRVKVALLADIAIRNLSVKLDRITDLLIIIDSVRSHRGFVVIATTHIPSILDPALRRPGRFDETLTIPSLPNLWSRWEILKGSTADFVSTLDLMDFAQLFHNLNDTELSTVISKTKLFLLTKQNFLNQSSVSQNKFRSNQINFNFFIGSSVPISGHTSRFKNILTKQSLDKNLSEQRSDLVNTSLNNLFELVNPNSNNLHALHVKQGTATFINSFGTALKFSTYPLIIDPFDLKLNEKNGATKILTHNNFNKLPFLSSLIGKSEPLLNNFTVEVNSVKSLLKTFKPSLSNFKTTTTALSISYFQISKWFIRSQLIKDQQSYTTVLWAPISQNIVNTSDFIYSNASFIESSNQQQNSLGALYNSKTQLKNELLELFAGKIGELFAFYDIKSMTQFLQPNLINNTSNFNLQNFEANLTTVKGFWSEFQSINTWQYSGLINSYGLDQNWRRTSDLIFSIIYKRCLYNKNILIYRLFNFENINALREPPSPPVSSIFTPAKRYENYKRIEFDFQNRITFSVHEKLQKHQQQRYIKTLYNRPIQKYFRSELQSYTKNFKLETSFVTNFQNSFREVNLIDITKKFESQNKSSRLTASYYFFNNRINLRHRFYLTNQWWNTQLAEHNAETTFLSEIDWRYMFIEGIGDLWMDFPDTDQHYNPRKRQWMITSGYWSYWHNLDKLMTHEIYYQFLMESFYKVYNFLDTSRELIDFTCYQFLTNSLLKEIDLLTNLKRFYLN